MISYAPFRDNPYEYRRIFTAFRSNSRQSFKIQYPLFDILFLTVCAVIAGAEG